MAISVYISYNNYPDFYYQCREMECKYTEIEGGCRITVGAYICTQIPCFMKNTTGKCYMPDNAYMCPTESCYGDTYLKYAIQIGFVTLTNIFFFVFVIYWLIECCRKKHDKYYSLD